MPTLTDAQIAGAARSAGFTGPALVIAVAVSLAESGGRSDATNRNSNGTTDFGLWQINSIHKAELAAGSWSNPTDNAIMAHKVWASAGGSFRPWVTFTRGTYLAFMARAGVAANSPQNAPSVATPASTPQDAPPGPLDPLLNFLKFLSDPNTWKRLVMFTVGAFMLLWGLMKATGNNQLSSATKSLVKAAGKAAVVA